MATHQVLAVEGDSESLAGLTETLEGRGHEVRGFSRHADAYAWFRENPSWPEIVLTDQGALGAPGLELANLVRQLRPTLPVVLLTSQRVVEQAELRHAPIEALLKKPVNAALLFQAIDRLAVDSALPSGGSVTSPLHVGPPRGFAPRHP